jgi:serine/threonine protein kinase
VDRTEPREITESFRLERVLKSSRSAIVFRAAGPGTGATVAIKLIPPGSAASLDSSRQRFLAAMSTLDPTGSRNFPALLDYGFCPDGSAFMVMEFVYGGRLDSLTDARPDRVLRLILGALDGLESLARNGFSHGNLAPENFLVAGPPDSERAVILGFGTAAFHGGLVGVSGVALTEGPAQFAAPEQLDPTLALTADWRSDLYALAASTSALLHAEIIAADAPAPSVSLPVAVRERLVDPVALQVILEQCLRREPGDRPTSLEEFRQAVNAALSGVAAEPEFRSEEFTAPLATEGAAFSQPEPEQSQTPVEPATSPEEGESTVPTGLVPSFEEPSGEATPTREPPADATPQPAAPPTPAVEKVKTGPVPIQRLAELPTAPYTVRQEQPQPEVEPPPAPMPAVEPTPVPVAEPGPAPSAAADVQPGTPPGEQPQSEAVGEPVEAKPATAAPRKKRRVLPWAAGIAAIVVIGTAVGWLWIQSQQSGRPSTRPAPTAAPRRPSPAPQPAPTNVARAQLEKAEAAVALADMTAAGAALDSISPEDVAGLSQAEQERYTTIRAAYATLRRQTITQTLRRALATGNIRVLGETVRDISREEELSFKRDADFSASLDEGRRVLNLQTLMLKAQRQGDQAQVLESASVLTEIAPRYAAAAEAREKAAVSLERDADALAARGSFDQALARLDALHRSWPARSGLQARLERVKAAQEADRKLAAVIAQAQQAGAENAPEKGLELLKSLPADPRIAERAQQMRERLTNQLAQLDAQPPTLALAPGLKLEYKKGEPVTLAFKIQDDHTVRGAQLFARVEGSGRFVELPFRHAGGADWSGEISLAFHQNQTVEFYAAATDYSGHTTMLGSSQQPLKLKRKKNIFGF